MVSVIFGHQKAMANVNLGDFDISLNGENMPEFIDTRTTSKHTCWVEPLQSLSASVIQLDLPLTENPVNLKKSYLKIRGKSTLTPGVAANATVSVTPFAFYNIFNKAELRMGTADTLIEKYDDALPMYLMQRAATMTDFKSLIGRRLFDEGVCVPKLEATEYDILHTIAGANWGKYDEKYNSDLFAADGTFEIILPLARLFETINTMETMYKGTLKTRLILTPKVTGDMGSTGGPGSGIVHAATATEAVVAGTTSGFTITQVKWYYDEYTLEPTTAQAFNTQYQSDVEIPHRVQRCIKDTIPSGSTSYSKIVQLEAAGLGAQCLMLMFRDKREPEAVGYPLKLFMPRINRMVIKLGGKTVIDISPTVKSSAGLSCAADHHLCLEFYENFRQCASIFGLDESEIMPFQYWLRMFPIFTVDLTNFAPVDIKGINPFEVTITFAEEIGNKEYEIYYGLIADEIMTLDCSTKAISKIVK